MQTQTSTTISNFIDRENLLQNMHRTEAWFFFYPNRISMLMTNRENKQIFGLSVLEVPGNNLFDKGLFDLKELLKQFEFFDKEFQQAIPVIVSPYYTFVPEALFIPEKASIYLNLVHQLPKFHGVYHKRMKQTVNIFGASDIFYNTLRVLFPQSVVKHYSELLSDGFQALQDNTVKNRLYVNIHKQYMDVFHFEQKELAYHNTFPVEADTDIIYFLLAAAETLKLSQEKLSVFISGDILANNSLVNLMKKYIPSVELLKKPEYIDYPASFREFPEQQYYIETCSVLCE